MHLATWRAVFLFVLATTSVAALAAMLITFVSVADSGRWGALRHAFTTAVVIAVPMALFIGTKIKQSTAQSEELQRMINRDRLTDVATREHFFQHVSGLKEQTGVVLMIDIDHFKEVNDTYGHLFGDAVLSRVAQAIDQETRGTDVVARFGGEEFIVFLSDVDDDGAFQIGDRVRHRVEHMSVEKDSVSYTATVSIGAAPAAEGTAIETAIKLADDALYHAKRTGRNKVVLSTDLPARRDTPSKRDRNARAA